MRIEWNPAKSETNRIKHGIAFERAQLVFDDPFCVTFPERVVDGEERWHAIGLIAEMVIVVVVHTYRMEGDEKVIRIISARRATRRETGNFMPKLSKEARKELEALAAMPDNEIDMSDIPELREFPSDAVVGRFYRPKKTTVTMRLDADVVAWLKASGEGYQTRINAYLRELMYRLRPQRRTAAQAGRVRPPATNRRRPKRVTR